MTVPLLTGRHPGQGHQLKVTTAQATASPRDILGSVTEPLPPLIQVATDIARQSTLNQLLSGQAALTTAVADLSRRVDILMSQDASVAAAAARIEADEAAVLAALRSIQGLVEALQAEVAAGNLSQATMDALAKAQADMDALRTEAEADAAADAPPSGA